MQICIIFSKYITQMSTTISHMFSQLDSTIPYSAWAKLGQDIDSEVVCDESGYSVSLSADGRTVAIGAKANDAGNANVSDNRGHVRIYQYDANKIVAVTDQTSATFGPVGWNRVGSDIDGESANDQSGYSLALSADGRTVAIGANLNDAAGNNSGHVRIFSYNGTDWTRLGSDIDGEAASDQSGYSVSLSADGRTVAIGAIFNDGNGGSIMVRSYYTGIILKPRGYFIEHYNANLELVSEFNYKLKDANYVDAFVRNGQVYLLFLDYNYGKKTYDHCMKVRNDV